MSDPKYHDRHTAAIYRAIALRFYCRYVQMRHSAEHYGADLNATHGRLPSEREVVDQYTAAIKANGFGKPLHQRRSRWSSSPGSSRPIGSLAVLRDQIIAEERDAFYQTVALSTAAEWLNRLAMNGSPSARRVGLPWCNLMTAEMQHDRPPDHRWRFPRCRREIAELHAERAALNPSIKTVGDEQRLDKPISDRMWALYDQITLSPPGSLVSAAVKRLLADPDLGLETTRA
jgi:hypothetical protein